MSFFLFFFLIFLDLKYKENGKVNIRWSTINNQQVNRIECAGHKSLHGSTHGSRVTKGHVDPGGENDIVLGLFKNKNRLFFHFFPLLRSLSLLSLKLSFRLNTGRKLQTKLRWPLSIAVVVAIRGCQKVQNF